MQSISKGLRMPALDVYTREELYGMFAAEANLDAGCRQGSVDRVSGAGTLTATGDTALAIAAAQDAAGRNVVGGEPCVIDASDVVFGFVERSNATSRYTFTPTTTAPSAVRVTASEQRPYVLSILADSLTVQCSTVAGQADRDLVLVLDRSGSMVTTNDDGTSTGWTYGDSIPPNSRWAKAGKAINSGKTAGGIFISL